jgi:hypothetical protein
VRRVGVVKTAAVGAELLDHFLARDRPAGDGLLTARQSVDDLVVQVEVLDRPTGDQHDRTDDRDRQQDADDTADQIDPEVAQLTSAPAGESPHQRDGDRHADRGGHEVLHRQSGHLHEMTEGGFPGVVLPVRVGHEADRGVPCQRRCHRRRRVVQVPRQLVLDQLKYEQEQDAERRERQHASGIGAPGLLGVRVGTDQPVNHPLGAKVLLGRVDAVHVVAEGHMDERDRGHQCDEKDDPCCCRIH